jgi:hypothetical protein
MFCFISWLSDDSIVKVGNFYSSKSNVSSISVDVMGQLEINLLFNENMPENASTPVDFAKIM